MYLYYIFIPALNLCISGIFISLLLFQFLFQLLLLLFWQRCAAPGTTFVVIIIIIIIIIMYVLIHIVILLFCTTTSLSRHVVLFYVLCYMPRYILPAVHWYFYTYTLSNNQVGIILSIFGLSSFYLQLKITETHPLFCQLFTITPCRTPTPLPPPAAVQLSAPSCLSVHFWLLMVLPEHFEALLQATIIIKIKIKKWSLTTIITITNLLPLHFTV